MDEILARLERIERRLDNLEGRTTRSFAPPPPPIAVPVMDGEDLERALASRWLPRAGAVAVIAAIGYLVGLGLEQGLITPAMVAVGVAVVCAAAALLGASLREDREGFGNVLVGLGAGGLYVDAVGSHLYHGLLNGDATVLLCVAIGLATLGFGARRGLPSFLGVGLFGGLLAALMPLTKGQVGVASPLFLLVTVPAFAVAARRHWPMAVAGAWLASFLAGLAILLSPGEAWVRLLPLDGGMLMALAAWGWAAEPLPTGDPQGIFPFGAAISASASTLYVLAGGEGMGHLLALGGFAVAVGRAVGKRPSGSRVRMAGTAIAAIVAPLALAAYPASTVLAGFALSGVATAFVGVRVAAPGRDEAARRGVWFWAGAFAAAQAGLAIACYAYGALTGEPPTFEPELIVLLAVAAVAAATALDRSEARVAAGAIVWGLATRLGVIGLDLSPETSITVAWIAVVAGLLAVGFVRRRPELRQLGLLVAAATAAKVILVDLAGLDAASKAAVLLGLGMVFLAGGYAYVRANR